MLNINSLTQWFKPGYFNSMRYGRYIRSAEVQQFMDLRHIRERHQAAALRFDFFTNIAAMYSLVMNSIQTLIHFSRQENPELNPGLQTIQIRKSLCHRMIEQLVNIVPFSIQACRIYQTIRAFYIAMLQTEVSLDHSYVENIMTAEHMRAWHMIFLGIVVDINIQFEVCRACLETAESQLMTIVDEIQLMIQGQADTEVDSGDSD